MPKCFYTAQGADDDDSIIGGPGYTFTNGNSFCLRDYSHSKHITQMLENAWNTLYSQIKHGDREEVRDDDNIPLWTEADQQSILDARNLCLETGKLRRAPRCVRDSLPSVTSRSARNVPKYIESMVKDRWDAVSAAHSALPPLSQDIQCTQSMNY